MRLIKPSWVKHDGFPIFSLDIHPDGSRFATGGQGAGDSGRVVIWNMAPVIDEALEAKENVPKYLSRMDNHLNCVNCVRWSTEGKYLASGGDDKVIMIWQIARVANNNNSITNHSSFTSSPAFSSSSNVETWRCVATLRGHSGDILDINWCPVEPRLASCSVDNSIIVWNTAKWNEILITISGHTGLVKGVSWDPVGKYLASQSDDKSLKIWRTADWKEEQCITEPFVECGGTTHVLRLNWSPDGQQIVSAHAMNNCGSTAQIIDREGWAVIRDLVGHRKAVTCVRFNPNMLKKMKSKEPNNNTNRKKDKETLYSCVAVGSRDRSVSVWMTSLTRPLVVVHELFTNSVLDISWSQDGRRLLACSWDGSVACLDFEPQELGQVISKDETNLYLEKLYGKLMKKSETNNHVLIEDVDIIRAREEKLKNAAANTSHSNGVSQPMNESMSDSRSNTSSRIIKGPTDKQIEIKMVNGKRRITPLYLPPPIDLDGIPLPYNHHQEINFSTSTAHRSKIPIERRDDSNLSFASPGKDSQPGTANQSSPPEPSSTPQPKPPSQDVSKLTSSSKRKSESKVDSSPAAKRKPGRPPGSQQMKEVVDQPPIPVQVGQSTTVTVSKNRTEVRGEKKARIQLSGLKIEKSATFSLSTNQTIEVENNIRNTVVCILRLTCGGTANWEVILTSKITALTACDFMSAVVTDDNLVSVFSTSTGRRLHLPIVLNSPVSRIDSREHYLMIITVDGRLSVYNFKAHSSVVRSESLMSLFSEGNKVNSNLTITYSEITSNGTPIVSLSNKKSFIFDPDFKHWSLLSNPSDLLNNCSDLKPSGHRSEPDSYPLARIQALTSKGTRLGSNIFSTNSALQSKATISFIDQQLAASFVVGSKAEYKFWLLSLAQALTDEAREDRLRELCTFLMGPVLILPSAEDNESWPSTILGHSKRALLNEVLLVMTSNLRLQRLYTEFKDQLSFSNSVTPPSSGTSAPVPSNYCKSSQQQPLMSHPQPSGSNSQKVSENGDCIPSQPMETSPSPAAATAKAEEQDAGGKEVAVANNSSLFPPSQLEAAVSLPVSLTVPAEQPFAKPSPNGKRSTSPSSGLNPVLVTESNGIASNSDEHHS